MLRMTTENNTDDFLPNDRPGYKTCSCCREVKPHAEFARNGSGRHSRCLACMREASRRSYQERAGGLREQELARIALLDQLVDTARLTAVCSTCGGTEALLACTVDGSRPSDLARQKDVTKLVAAVAAAHWSCKSCRATQASRGTRGHSLHSKTPTMPQAILSAVGSGCSTIPEIFDAVLTVRDTTTESLRQTLRALRNSGQLVSAGRGRFAMGAARQAE